MTRKLIAIIFAALFIGFHSLASSDSLTAGASFDKSVVQSISHPRLLLTGDALAEFRAALASEGESYASLKEMDRIVREKAKSVLVENKDIEKASDKTTNLNHLLPLAYCYRVHSDENMLPKLKKDLIDICSGDWGSGFLAISENSVAVSLAYDWIWDRLDEGERALVSNALLQKMLQPSVGAKFHGISGNWMSICNCGVVMASLAIWERNPEIASKCFEESVECVFRNTGKVYNDGGYPEGFSYWNYGSQFQICLIEAMRSVFGHDGGLATIPAYLESCYFALYAHSTTGGSFSFADGGSTHDHPLIAAWWFAAELKDAVPLFVEKRFLDQGKYEKSYSRMLPALIPLFRRFDPDKAGFTAPEAEVWSCQGEMPLCIVRRGWGWNKDDVYLGVKGGYANTWKTMMTSHGHMDAGSFVFETDGVRWSDDVMRPSYGPWFSAMKAAGGDSGDTWQDGIRWNTFNVSNLCHSCLISTSNDGSIPGKLHPGDYYVDGSASVSVINKNGRQGAKVDMSEPMKGQVKSALRTIVVLEDGTLEVTDEIEALPGLDCSLEWRMLTKASAELSADGIILSGKNVKKTLTVSATGGLEPKYALIVPEAPEAWKNGWYYCQTIKSRTIASWNATVPAGKKVVFVTRLAK